MRFLKYFHDKVINIRDSVKYKKLIESSHFPVAEFEL